MAKTKKQDIWKRRELEALNYTTNFMYLVPLSLFVVEVGYIINSFNVDIHTQPTGMAFAYLITGLIIFEFINKWNEKEIRKLENGRAK